MVTEEEARLLLQRAAGTIDVADADPPGPAGLGAPARRPLGSRLGRVGVVAAAGALVAGIAGVGLVVERQFGREAEPAGSDGPPDRAVAEQERVYDDDEMPSLLGYTSEEARVLLGERGLEVRRDGAFSCDQPEGFVLGSDPGPGEAVRPGDVVTLRVTAGPAPAVRCAVPTDEWQQVFDLVRFARGLDGPPVFAEEVTLWVGEGEPVTISADEAAAPESWVLCLEAACHSGLDAVAELATRPEPQRQPLRVSHRPPVGADTEASCVTPDPFEQALTYHRPTFLWSWLVVDGVPFCPAPVVQIEWDEDHRIAAVGLRLAAEGTTAESIDEEQLDERLTRASTATRFAAWSRGEGPAPEFADRVRYLVGGEPPFGAPTWVDDPTDPAQWAACSGLPAGRCGIDPRAVLDRYAGRVVQTPTRATCPDGGDVPSDLAEAAATDLVRLDRPEAPSCRDAWAVELWIDGEGAIYAVNLAVAAP